MTEAEIKTLIEPHVKREGVFVLGEFDLDMDVKQPYYGKRFCLWFDGDTSISIDLPLTLANAALIQKAVRSFGREVIHTWDMQYSSNL